ncbi:MAG: hypothetical protein NVS2B7_19500 [Herpetosiphon sp.]
MSLGTIEVIPLRHSLALTRAYQAHGPSHHKDHMNDEHLRGGRRNPRVSNRVHLNTNSIERTQLYGSRSRLATGTFFDNGRAAPDAHTGA